MEMNSEALGPSADYPLDVLEAAQGGVLANLVAQGEIADDETQTVIAELQALISQHGGEVLAEDFIREP